MSFSNGTVMKQSFIKRAWVSFWMLFAGPGVIGHFAMRMAYYGAPPYSARSRLAYLAGRKSAAFVSPGATIYHENYNIAPYSLIDDDVLIFQDEGGKEVTVDSYSYVYDATRIQTGSGGSVEIGAHTHIQPRCQLSAYEGAIRIGDHVEIAPNCAFYSYDHSVAPGELIQHQPLTTEGDIIIEDDVWLGYGVIVLSGVHIGEGAVIGAGSVVTEDVPANAVAVGSPARVIQKREHVAQNV